MRRLGDRGIHGGAVRSGVKVKVALVLIHDGVHCLKNCDVNDRHRAARSCGPKLLAGCYGHVVESTGIDGELIPVLEPSDRIGSLARWVSWHDVELRTGIVARPQETMNIVRLSVG